MIVPNLNEYERREAYNADITYGTNNEFGFDYLRDNMKHERGQMVQRPFNFAIVDEVDSILIDEARTPLIISGPTEDKSDLYISIDEVVKNIPEDWYEKDEKSASIQLTEEGTEAIEKLLIERGLLETDNLYDVENTQVVHHLDQALRANIMFKRDTDYIVKDDKVVIIDEFTGRMMDGRRWSNGLHQAVEAKEGVKIEPENQTMASITFQNYFRMYPKLSGMTGTAATEAAEFWDIYKMNVVEIPTNVAGPADRRGRRVLQEHAWTSSRPSPRRSRRRTRSASRCWSARSRSRRANCSASSSIRKASSTRSSTPASTSARRISWRRRAASARSPSPPTWPGRGTDIQLGGNRRFPHRGRTRATCPTGPSSDAAIARIKEEVAAETPAGARSGRPVRARHRTARIAAGSTTSCAAVRAARATPACRASTSASKTICCASSGPTRCFRKMMNSNLEDGEAIGSKWLSKAIETAQKKVEARNYEMRKQVVEYDDVMNDQRKVIYEQRAEIMDSEAVDDVVVDMRHDTINAIVGTACPPGSYPEQWDIDGSQGTRRRRFRARCRRSTNGWRKIRSSPN